MIEAGHDQVTLGIGQAVRQCRSADEVEVRYVGEQGAVQPLVVVQVAAQAEPELLVRRHGYRVPRVLVQHRAELERPKSGEPALKFLG